MKRLTPALLTMLMLGVVALLVGAYAAKSLFAKTEKPVAPQQQLIPMANSDIEPGTVITENHLGKAPVLLEKLERDMLRTERMIVGRVAKTAIKAAQPIRATQLYAAGELPPLNVSPGMRAVTIEVGDSTSIVDGMIKPGNFVDALFTVNSGVGDDALQGGLTMRLLEGVRVIAINRNFTQSRVDRGNNRVTLELTEEQANVVTLASDRGSLRLTYNPNGKGSDGLALTGSDRVTLYEILGLKKKEPEPEPHVTEIYRGSGRDVLRFGPNGRSLDAGGGGNGGNYMGYNNGYGYSMGNGRDQFVLPNGQNRNGQTAPVPPGQRNNPAPGAMPFAPTPGNMNPVPPAVMPGTPNPASATAPQRHAPRTPTAARTEAVTR